MSGPSKGPADFLQLGDWNARCVGCNAKFKASELKKLPPGVPGSGLYACSRCWEARHPQEFVRGIPDKMSAPWTQNPANGYLQWSDTVDEDTDTYTPDVDSGAGTVIITIPSGVTVDEIDLSTLPETVTTVVINVSGGLGPTGVTGTPAWVTVQINTFGGTIVSPQGTPYTLVSEQYDYPPGIPPYDYTFFGMIYSTAGSVTPTELEGITIYTYGDHHAGTVSSDHFEFAILGAALQDLFTSITINGSTYASADASFGSIFGISFWTWPTLAGLTGGTSYDTLILLP